MKESKTPLSVKQEYAVQICTAESIAHVQELFEQFREEFRNALERANYVNDFHRRLELDVARMAQKRMNELS